ncbi:uncharacterized protein BDR25DRAFT_309392 [Lindgomyces ingoldianus]|uniref:Uncharacterized protein n=1 Tax=Lindgomyces ingoldianus TaxID=673940 RepID=A0ACB6RCT4_9PLEO|nr:uncharacterized protein BDR25DRAFT_309392 [Lindgomyces ingoldianus]KAF2477088.1 hypothetical protein BDR25DRAFT_309392 [Lindgomyces ingoldianus]
MKRFLLILAATATISTAAPTTSDNCQACKTFYDRCVAGNWGLGNYRGQWRNCRDDTCIANYPLTFTPMECGHCGYCDWKKGEEHGEMATGRALAGGAAGEAGKV